MKHFCNKKKKNEKCTFLRKGHFFGNISYIQYILFCANQCVEYIAMKDNVFQLVVGLFKGECPVLRTMV